MFVQRRERDKCAFILGKGIQVKQGEEGQRKLAALEMPHSFQEEPFTVRKGLESWMLQTSRETQAENTCAKGFCVIWCYTYINKLMTSLFIILIYDVCNYVRQHQNSEEVNYASPRMNL